MYTALNVPEGNGELFIWVFPCFWNCVQHCHCKWPQASAITYSSFFINNTEMLNYSHAVGHRWGGQHGVTLSRLSLHAEEMLWVENCCSASGVVGMPGLSGVFPSGTNKDRNIMLVLLAPLAKARAATTLAHIQGEGFVQFTNTTVLKKC